MMAPRSPALPAKVIALVAMALAMGSGCSPAKREAAALSDAVRRFHEADNPAKPSAAAVVAKVVCTDATVCQAKEACVKATGDWGDALRLMGEAQAGLSDIKAGKLSPQDDGAKALVGKLAEAQTKLSSGHDAIPSCDALLLQLRAQYDL